MQMDYTVRTDKTYAEAVKAVVESAQNHGFRVQMVHDVAETLAEKGFQREPMTIVEMCNAKHAHAVLARDPKIGLMLPCPVMVYEEDGTVNISTMRPTLIGGFFPQADLDEIAAEVERSITEIVDEAAA
ncbi:MAG: DUF302 domain-containing protein [Coriobacteriales bacterium]|nr:DUF302 domain-containing protein [Coriobacteriales bacterium]